MKKQRSMSQFEGCKVKSTEKIKGGESPLPGADDILCEEEKKPPLTSEWRQGR